MDDDILVSAKALQNLLIEIAKNGDKNKDKEFDKLRNTVLSDKTIASKVPAFLYEVRSCNQFWNFIKPRHTGSSWAERTRYIYDEFQPLLRYLENKKAGISDAPHNNFVKSALLKINSKHVVDDWEKALSGCETDPENAISMARTLIESVCKSILEEVNDGADNAFDIGKLYNKVAKHLKLHPAELKLPSEYNKQVFEQILKGCITVVTGLAALRNNFGDAHGKGKGKVKPQPRTARLAVNLSGAMASYLVETWEYRSQLSGQSNTY